MCIGTECAPMCVKECGVDVYAAAVVVDGNAVPLSSFVMVMGCLIT